MAGVGAIALAIQAKAPLLIDDDQARRIARYYRVHTFTTMGIILEFLLADKITRQEYAGNVRRFASQAWISPDVVEEFLRRAT
jgi:predicted nucleic acid-binding protein